MNIVILDGNCVIGRDINFDAFKKYGELTVYQRTPSELTAKRIGTAEIVFTNKVIIDKDVMDACPNIKFIGIFATGYNVVDIGYAKQKNIIVSNVPAYSTDSVAQMTFALILELALNVGAHNAAVHAGDWQRSADFCFWVSSLKELAGKTLGIVGYGNIGKAVAKIGEAFKMKVLVHNRTPFAGCVSMDELYENSDVITLHCPLNDGNKGFINKDAIAKMKVSAYLINTARGGLINETDLAEALNSGRIAGAAVDVVSVEPIRSDNPLLTAKNCIITPHIAWAPLESRQRLLVTAESNLKAFLDGHPQNVVNY